MPILEMKNIVKQFPGVRALNGAQLTLEPGEVHALVGENGAGKSTLMKILLGIHQPTSGQILFKGKPFQASNPREALHAGISMIHQEISLVPSMSVAENIWLGQEESFSRWGFLNFRARDEKTKELIRRYGLNIDHSKTVSSLSVANMQLVEILRAVSYNSDVIIMDEPSSALTSVEINILYSIIRKLKSEGVAVVYISHKLDEIAEICDKITVLRDGKFIAEEKTEGLDQDTLIKYIVGREVSDLFPKLDAEIGEVIFEVKNLSKAGVFEDVSFQVRRGEILGFSGLMGAGRSEILSAVFGIDSIDSGEIFIEGKPVTIRSPKEAVELGLGMVTEDRLRRGVIHKLSVKMNLTVAELNRLSRFGFLDSKTENRHVSESIAKVNVKVSSPKVSIAELSGGNQQKCIIGKWLLTEPKILILDEPTRGIDVGSKSEIHRLVSMLAQQGKAIIMISSELPEVLGMSDRVLVVHNGRIVSEYARGQFDSEKMMQDAFGLPKAV